MSDITKAARSNKTDKTDNKTQARASRFALLTLYVGLAPIIDAVVGMARKTKRPILDVSRELCADKVTSAILSLQNARSEAWNCYSAEDCARAGDKGKALAGKSVAMFVDAVLRDGATLAQIRSSAKAVASTLSL